MHVLVTGGAGFIGSHLVGLLMKQGHEVHVVDDLSTGLRANLAEFEGDPKFRFDEADIITWDGLWQAAQWADRIFHLAAVVGVRRVLESPVHVMATNIAGTERVLRAAAASGWRPRVIIASSSEAYGFNPHMPLNEADDLIFKAGSVARWSYAISKLAGEHLANAYVRGAELPIVTLRFFNTIGSRQRGEYGMVVPNFVRQAVQGIPITVFGGGKQTRSFCDVRDTVVMIAKIAEVDDAIGEVINLGNDQEISIEGLAKLVKRRANSSSKISYLSRVEGYGEDFDDVARRRPDLTRLRSLIDFLPKYTLDDTIDELIAGAKRPGPGILYLKTA